mmetsp:Transcript_102696/g.331371  ORF Transcript_102696/g.331371 Transcript_102696/m.331371 type:complete len:208 (-) Transcript_102696:819-1442(-)
MTSATISSRPNSLEAKSNACLRPSWKAFTALCDGETFPLASALPSRSRASARAAVQADSLAAQSASTAAVATSLQETASNNTWCALRRSSSANSNTQSTFWSASCTKSFGGRRATVASMATHRGGSPSAPPGAPQRTLEGFPRHIRDFTGKRSALPRRTSSTKSRPKAWAEVAKQPGSHAAFSLRKSKPRTNCITNMDCLRPNVFTS